MKTFPKILKNIGAITIWRDGNGISFIWRWWHPVTWFFVPLLFIANVFLEGLPNTWKYKDSIGLGLSNYWKKNKNKRKFL